MGRNDPTPCSHRWGTCNDGQPHKCGEWYFPGTDEPHAHICERCNRPK
jgi:hypothetical protein